MKKLLAFLLVFVICASTVACGETSDDAGAPVVVTQTARYEVVPAPANDPTTIVYAATDNIHNYYVLDLGYVKNVPLSSCASLYYNGTTITDVTYERSKVTEESVSNSLTKAFSETVTKSSSGSASTQVSAKFGFNIKLVETEVSVAASYSRQWGTEEERSNSTSNTYSTATTTANQMSETYAFRIGENGEAAGCYRLSLLATCDVYAFIVMSADNSEIQELTYTYSARDDGYLALEYSETNYFGGDVKNSLTVTESYCQTLPMPETVIEEGTFDAEYNTISVAMNRYDCKDKTEYDKTKPETDGNWKSRHNGFEMGQLNLYGCRQMGNVYEIGSIEDLAIRYQVLQDSKALPLVGTATSSEVWNDDATGAKGTDINSRIGYGAYWVRITYSDDSQVQHNKTNIFQYANDGTIIEILTEEHLDATKTVVKVEVVIVYELHVSGPGVWPWYWDETPNWRCEYTFNFAG